MFSQRGLSRLAVGFAIHADRSKDVVHAGAVIGHFLSGEVIS
jgi:hypothetical protein